MSHLHKIIAERKKRIQSSNTKIRNVELRDWTGEIIVWSTKLSNTFYTDLEIKWQEYDSNIEDREEERESEAYSVERSVERVFGDGILKAIPERSGGRGLLDGKSNHPVARRHWNRISYSSSCFAATIRFRYTGNRNGSKAPAVRHFCSFSLSLSAILVLFFIFSLKTKIYKCTY